MLFAVESVMAGNNYGNAMVEQATPHSNLLLHPDEHQQLSLFCKLFAVNDI